MSLPSQSDVEQVADSARALLADGWEPWPGGQKGKIELALIDAVFSIRARYGQPSDAETGRNATGVPAIVEQWRKRPGVDGVDDLRHLSSMSETDLLAVLRNRSRTSGRTKAAAVIDASASLEGVGIVHAAQFIAGVPAARKAYVRVHGLGWVTFNYMCMLLGVHDVKADVWIVRFVQDALRRDVDNAYTRAVMLSVAEVFAGEEGALPRDATNLDHAIWYARARVVRQAACQTAKAPEGDRPAGARKRNPIQRRSPTRGRHSDLRSGCLERDWLGGADNDRVGNWFLVGFVDVLQRAVA